VGKLLAYLGAEVIRVESEDSLDVTRTYGVADRDNAPGFQSVNAQKLSVQINMKSERGVQLILDLLRQSDIVVENLRPGATRRLGLGYEQVRQANPAIVYVAMGMYGSDGPLSYQTGYAPCFAALGGVSALVGYAGEAPRGMNIRYADSTFGAAATYAALVALLHRRRSGEGQFVDVSAVECMSGMIGDALVDHALNGAAPACAGNRHAEMAPHGAYPCAGGGWLAIAVTGDAQWRALAAAMGRPELAAEFTGLATRQARSGELDALLAAWTAQHDARALESRLQQAGVAATASRSSLDLVADAQLWERGFFREVTDAAGRGKATVGPPWRMTRAAAVTDGAPVLGQHNDYVLQGILGLSAEEQARLEASGVAR